MTKMKKTAGREHLKLPMLLKKSSGSATNCYAEDVGVALGLVFGVKSV